MQLLDHLAGVTNNGSPSSSAPARRNWCTFTAGMKVHNDPASSDDFRSLLRAHSIRIAPGSDAGKASRSAQQVYIGSVITESGFVESEFGDRILAFQHAWGSKNSSV